MAPKRKPAKMKRRPSVRTRIESDRTQLGRIMFKELKELTKGTVSDKELRLRVRERLNEFTDAQVIKLLGSAKK